ncbi:AzlC family ABC transporter permease [Actinomyces slackii]|uniref:Inner membrane protein YgaZ n=1 Tax=Actinomyces slackii TaxID=52774 RepID=A0A3S4UMN7_9ACTO|nr:AzlC family ABC transporter permease [Actinomyces slackii]VEG74113.1 Inner membrane protein YgaZ [Actinomyces slackii]
MTSAADAARDAVPVMIGYVTLGLAAGMLLVAAGLTWWWAPIWSLVIYSGTMQMLLVPLVAAGQPLAAIALSTGFVSGRHVFYGLGFPLHRVRSGLLARLYGVHAITDEVYALLSSKDRQTMSGRYVLVVEALCHSAWITGTTAGALAGTGLARLAGERIELLGFVLTSLFVVLAIENWRAHPDAAVLCAALVASAAGFGVGGSTALLVSLLVLAVGLVLLFVWRRSAEAQPGGAQPGGSQGDDGAHGPTDNGAYGEAPC